MSTELISNLKGLTVISGPTKSGKSIWAEKLLANHKSVTYIATSKERKDDLPWQKRIKVHKERRPNFWNFISYNSDFLSCIESIEPSTSILIDSLGGIVERHLNDSDKDWENNAQNILSKLSDPNRIILLVVDELSLFY